MYRVLYSTTGAHFTVQHIVQLLYTQRIKMGNVVFVKENCSSYAVTVETHFIKTFLQVNVTKPCGPIQNSGVVNNTWNKLLIFNK